MSKEELEEIKSNFKKGQAIKIKIKTNSKKEIYREPIEGIIEYINNNFITVNCGKYRESISFIKIATQEAEII